MIGGRVLPAVTTGAWCTDGAPLATDAGSSPGIQMLWGMVNKTKIEWADYS